MADKSMVDKGGGFASWGAHHSVASSALAGMKGQGTMLDCPPASIIPR